MMQAPGQIQWLLEGPEKWNARRVNEPFKPDLSGTDLRDEFQKVRRRNNEKMRLRPIDLIGYNLAGVNLKTSSLATLTSSTHPCETPTSAALIYTEPTSPAATYTTPTAQAQTWPTPILPEPIWLTPTSVGPTSAGSTLPE